MICILVPFLFKLFSALFVNRTAQSICLLFSCDCDVMLTAREKGGDAEWPSQLTPKAGGKQTSIKAWQLTYLSTNLTDFDITVKLRM